jgi:hypothetical protein
MRMLIVAAVVACMSGAAFAAELSKTSIGFETAKCWVCGQGGNGGGNNGGNTK